MVDEGQESRSNDDNGLFRNVGISKKNDELDDYNLGEDEVCTMDDHDDYCFACLGDEGEL